MKIEATAGNLRAALRIAGHATERRNTIPVFGCVLIEGGSLRATDGDVEVEVAFASSVTRGALAVDHRMLSGIVSTLPADAPVTIDGTRTKAGTPATLSFPGGVYDLHIIHAEDFPPSLVDSGARFEPAPEGFGAALRFAAQFMSDEPTRYYLNGICLDGDTVIATDGHVIGAVTLGGPFEGSPIIPRRAVNILARIGDPRKIAIGKDGATFRLDGATVRTRLVDGTFPDWRRVVPTLPAKSARVTLERRELNAALRRVAAVAGKSGGASCITLTLRDEDCVLTATSLERDAARERLGSAIVANAPEARSIKFSAKLVALVSGAHKAAERLTLSFENAGAPCLVDDSEKGRFSVIMPMRIAADDESGGAQAVDLLAARRDGRAAE